MGLFSSPESKIKWEKLEGDHSLNTFRCKVPGGWVIAVRHGPIRVTGVTFMPDPNHSWDGHSLE